jgi:hypothetical protein
VFRDGVGTCEQKHRCFVAAAHESGLDAQWVWGWYRLTDEIVPGVGEVLQRHRAPYVPMMHCVVTLSEGTWVDLTDGNCDGKTRRPNVYDELHEVSPWAGAEEVSALRAETRARWARRPEFDGIDLALVLAETSTAKTAACRVAGGRV